jgi:hypothetical protein
MDGVYLEDLLNGAPAGKNSSLKVQEIMCQQLREQFPKTPFSKENAHIVTTDQIGKGIEKAQRTALPEILDSRLKYVWVHNYSPLVSVENMFVPVAMLDSLRLKDGRKVEIKPEDLLGQDHLLAALALPKLGPSNISSLWTSALKNSLNSPLVAFDEAVQFSTASSSTGFALTTLLLSSKEGSNAGQFPVHVLRDGKKDLTLVIGESCPENLREFLKEAKIEFVDRYEGNARTKVQTFLNRMLIQAAPETEKLLISSFFHRNALPDFDLASNIDRLDTLKLADLLIHQKLIASRPILATRISEQQKLRSFLDQNMQAVAVTN